MSKMVKANPTKEFFVSMLVRDILLKQAIIELIDNSIDGAKSIKANNDYQGIEISVEFNEEHFIIKDNCGGISLDTAEKYAFRFGRPKNNVKLDNETTGIFGIGMKRALFKIGNYFEIKSTTEKTYFEVNLDVEKWKEDESNNWDFPFEKYEEDKHNGLESTGTEIKITDLYKEIIGEFKSLEFEKELIAHIQRRVGLVIDYGIKIIVNGQVLEGNHVELINSEEVQPVKEEFEQDNVKVKILAGIASKEGKSRYEPENAGWYIYCNGRLVIAADKTSLTTWKDMENKNSGIVFTNTYAKFVGSVFFNSNEPDKLPWNTTKTGIDESALVYLKAREKMIEIFKIVKGFIDEIRNNTDKNDDGIEETISQMQSMKLTAESAEKVENNRSLSISKITVMTNPNVTINYKKPKTDVELIKKMLSVTSNREVGEITFDYYKDAEC